MSTALEKLRAKVAAERAERERKAAGMLHTLVADPGTGELVCRRCEVLGRPPAPIDVYDIGYAECRNCSPQGEWLHHPYGPLAGLAAIAGIFGR